MLPKAGRPLATAWWACSCCGARCPALFAIAMGVLIGAVQQGDALGVPLALIGCRVRALQVLAPDPPGGEREPREPHRGVAERPADARLRRSAGHGAPRAPRAHQRPHDGARLRPRHRRAAARDRDGLHRDRSRRHGRRDRAGDRPRARTAGGRRSCSAARGRRRTGCCARARCGATATPTRCATRSGTPTTRTASRSTPPAAKEMRLFGLVGLDGRAVRRPAAPAVRAAVAGDAAARAVGRLDARARARGQRPRVLVARRRGVVGQRHALARSSCSRRPRSARVRSRSVA